MCMGITKVCAQEELMVKVEKDRILPKLRI